MAQKAPESISLVIPVFNEKNLLSAAVEKCIEALSKDFEDFEIILIDDGSTDGTGELMDGIAEEDKRVRVLHNIINLNVGISVQRGMAVSEKKYVLHSAVDMPLAVDDIAGLVGGMDDFDLLVLERTSYAGYSPWRWITSKINRAFLLLLFGLTNIKDMNFTQIYRTEVFPKILPLAKSPAFTTPEMILRAKAAGLRIKAVPAEYRRRPSGKGAFGKPHDILWSLYDMLRFRFKAWGELKKEKNDH